MLFTSATFAIFLTLVFFAYWFVFSKALRVQNAFLLIVSYIFYGFFDWRLLFILFFVSIFNYLIGIATDSRKGGIRKILFIFGLVVNIGTLVVFKYFNFFQEPFIMLLSKFGMQPNMLTLNILVPVGISFYIFLALSYIIDVYQRKMAAETNVVDLLLSLSFFPIILAGPIHRPANLLPQLRSPRSFTSTMGKDGLKQILWGLFMKVVIADQCSNLSNPIFANASSYEGSALLIGILLFTVQIYADFAGYSHMAIGIGKLMGFKLMQNFAYPYFARDIREFWRRWNISLTSWFRDYLFLPVAYYISGKIKSDRFLGVKTEFTIYTTGIIITWTVTGLWHGANITFILWGFLQGIVLILYHFTMKPRKRLLKQIHLSNNNKLLMAGEYFFTILIILTSFILFRSQNLHQALSYISGICSPTLFTVPNFGRLPEIWIILTSIILFFLVEWTGRSHEHPIASFGAKWPKAVRWVIFAGMFFAVFWFSGVNQQFFYFQF